MLIQLKMIPTRADGKVVAHPCNLASQFQIDLSNLAKFQTLRRNGVAEELPQDQDIEVLRRSVPRIFSEMFGVDLIEITYPDGGIEIWDKARQ